MFIAYCLLPSAFWLLPIFLMMDYWWVIIDYGQDDTYIITNHTSLIFNDEIPKCRNIDIIWFAYWTLFTAHLFNGQLLQKEWIPNYASLITNLSCRNTEITWFAYCVLPTDHCLLLSFAMNGLFGMLLVEKWFTSIWYHQWRFLLQIRANWGVPEWKRLQEKM